jgi:two-component system NtrC family sensor kinase
MAGAKILVVADTAETADYLTLQLLPGAGYDAVRADEFNPPPACDVIIVDISMLRSASPFMLLSAQRRMGCDAPALLYVPRLTEQMASDVFTLGVKDLVLKPVEDDVRLQKLADFVARTLAERDQRETSHKLVETQVDLARRLEEIKTLSRIGKSISSLKDTDTIISRIVEASVYLTQAEEGAIFLSEEGSGQLMLRAQQGMGTHRAEALQQPSNDSDAMVVLRTGQHVMKGGDTEHKVKTGYLARALINVPILLGSTVVGVLAVYNQSFRAFQDTDLAVLTSLADYTAIALDKVNMLSASESQHGASLESAKKLMLHAETLFDPVEGIESQVDTLLSGGFGALSESQHSAIMRVKQATIRLREVVGYMREAFAESGMSHTGSGR